MTSQVPALGMALKCFAEQLGGLRDAFQAQRISHVIPNFDGKQAEFRNWIKAIEKYALLARLPADQNRSIALQSSSGFIADFLQRYLNTHPGCKWGVLKQELSARFALVSDSMHALTLLGRIRQGRNENVQIFAERLLNLAQQAFQDQGGPVMEQQLKGFFINGLVSNAIQMKILRESPNTFQEAIKIATAEQNLINRFNLRVYGHGFRGQNLEPMEVDHSRPPGFGHRRPIQNWNGRRPGHGQREYRKRPFDRKNLVGLFRLKLTDGQNIRYINIKLKYQVVQTRFY